MPGRGRVNRIQVCIRKPCDYYECDDGKVYAHTTLGRSTTKFVECDACKGKGYVEEWVELKELLQKFINIGVGD